MMTFSKDHKYFYLRNVLLVLLVGTSTWSAAQVVPAQKPLLSKAGIVVITDCP